LRHIWMGSLYNFDVKEHLFFRWHLCKCMRDESKPLSSIYLSTFPKSIVIGFS
jgi:hypothetical protein